MLRFLRKYNKIILAVFGTLLLIVFLIPQAIDALFQYQARRGGAWAVYVTPEGEREELTNAAAVEAQMTFRVIMEGLDNPLQPLGVTDYPHWFLLRLEAEQAGLIPSPELARQALGGGEEGANELSALARESGVSPRQAAEAVAALIGVQQLLDLHASAGKVSDVRLRQFASENLVAAEAEAVVIPASADAADLPEPTEEEVRRQFEAYRDVARGEGEHGFGYRLPDRLMLEWVTVPSEDVRARLEAAGVPSSLEVRKYFLRNRAQFPAPPGVDAEDDEAVFQAVEDRVRRRLLDERTREELERIARFAEAELSTATRDLERDGPYRVLPEDWAERRIPLPKIAEDVQAEFGIELPEYTMRGDEWLEVGDVPSLGPIAFAATEKFGRRMTLRDLVTRLREFGGADDAFVQAGLAFPPLRGGDGSVYLVRVVDAQPAHAPETIDEVREEVVADLKRVAHFERLSQAAEELRRRATEEGLAELAEAHETRVQPLRRVALADLTMIQYGQRQPTRIPGLSESEPVVRDVVDRASELVRESVERGERISDLPLEARVGVALAPEDLAVVVYRITDVTPFLREHYLGVAPFLARVIQQEEIGDMTTAAFSYDALAERHGFELLQAEDAEEEAIEEEVAALPAGTSGGE